MIWLLLIILIALLPTLRYGDIVDEPYQENHPKVLRFSSLRQFCRDLRWKLYGSYTFRNRVVDRLFAIFLHLTTVYMVWWVFDLKTAMMWGVCPACIWVSVWRNGRRYQLSNMIALGILGVRPWGMVLYPLIWFTQASALPSFVLYVITGQWIISAGMTLLCALVFTGFWPTYKSRLRKKPNAIKRFYNQKLMVATRTLGYYVWKFLVPQREFMYPVFLQGYGTDSRETLKAFKADKWFYFGLLALVLMTAGLFYAPTQIGCFWFLLFMAPYSNLITLHQPNNTRYAILPAIGLYAAVSQLLPIWFVVGWLVAALGYFCLSMVQCKSQEDLFQYHFDHCPDSITPYIVMGRHYLKIGRDVEALRVIQAGLDRHPESWGLWYLVGLCRPQNFEVVERKLSEILPFQTFAKREEVEKSFNRLVELNTIR